MIQLNTYPGWKEWKGKALAQTLNFDEPYPLPSDKIQDNFRFSSEIERQHAVVIQYLGLVQTIQTLKDCEFYFRRYPFRGLPMSRSTHVTNVCEMYFGRFYEFKERIKKFFEAVKAVSPQHGLDIARFIKLYEKEFDQELRTRHRVHHNSRFEDIAIDRVFLTESMAADPKQFGWKRRHLADYRTVTKQWILRVRQRGARLDEFMEAIAGSVIASCPFISRAPEGHDEH
jgi:hypothetical protein